MPNLDRTFKGCVLLLFCVVAFAITAPAQTDVSSTPMKVVHGKPYVMVMINGHGPYRFMVDTGTGGEAIVSAELVQELGFPTVGRTLLSDPSKAGVHATDLVMIDSLVVAGKEFTEVRAVRHKIYGEDASCQGVLGFTMFEDYLLTLDFPNQLLTLSSGALVPDGESSVLPFRMPDGVPIAPMRIGDLRVEAQIDSGGTGLSLPERLIPRLRVLRRSRRLWSRRIAIDTF